jgi:hypothetical protein
LLRGSHHHAIGKMTSAQIRDVLVTNIDRAVAVTWSDATKCNVMVITVDDEGFVYDLIPPDPKTAYWTTFDEVLDVVPQRSP